MLLYKYVSLKALRKILETNSLGFTRLPDFNDPFDISITPFIPPKKGEAGFASGARAKIDSMIKAKNYGALSLTRSPENIQMWSHYADNHYGAVIEIDATKAKFNCPDKNFIPAFIGSVIYSSIPETGLYYSIPNKLETKSIHNFDINHFEKLQRLFLSKPLSWAYEEEVRVVKYLEGKPDKHEEKEFSNQSGKFNAIRINNDKMTYCFKMPEGAITSVILGSRAGNKLDNIKNMCANDVFTSVAKICHKTYTINTGIKENHLKRAEEEVKKMMSQGKIVYIK